MRFHAVIFDFYGTLTVSATASERVAAVEAVAEALDVPLDPFRTAWWEAWAQRCTGRLGDAAANLRVIAARIGARPTEEQIAAALAVRWEREKRFYQALRPDAVSTLRSLRERGMHTAVVSDCTHELPAAWAELPVAPYVEVPIFSVEAGVKKPDPLIYGLAASRLGVAPSGCIFVGDGGSNELTGAEAFGMTAVRILDLGGVQHRYESDDFWKGTEIADLAGVLPLVCP